MKKKSPSRRAVSKAHGGGKDSKGMMQFQRKNLLWDALLSGSSLAVLIIAAFLAFFGGTWYSAASNAALAGISLLNAAMLFYELTDLRRRIPLLLFQVSFNLLLLGRVYVAWLRDYDIRLGRLEADGFDSLYWSLQILAISLFCVYLAYRAGGFVFRRRELSAAVEGAKKIWDNPAVPVIRQLSRWVLYVSSLASFFSLANTALFVLRNGYLTSFTETAGVPTIISRFALFFTPAFTVFLATMPSAKQMRLPMCVYGVYLLASVFTGRRNMIVTSLMMLALYLVLRDNLLPKEKRVLTKRVVLVVCLLGLGGVYLLQIVAYLRSGMSAGGNSFLNTVVSFIDSQGASFRVIVKTFENLDFFHAKDAWRYFLFPLEMFVTNNSIGQTVFHTDPIISLQTAEFAENTYSYSHALTYLVDPTKYLRGEGFGTSYVAEAYVAFGTAGVVAVSLFLGLAFRWFSSMTSRSWPAIALGLIAFKSLIYLPRNYALSWITDVFNVTYLCFIVGLYLAAQLFLTLGTHLRKTPDSGVET